MFTLFVYGSAKQHNFISRSEDACKADWKGDGHCDDINNSEDCSWDGGDCCGSDVDLTYCTNCLCLDPNGDLYEPSKDLYLI